MYQFDIVIEFSSNMLKIFALVSTVSAVPTLLNFEEWKLKFNKQYDAKDLLFRKANFEASKLYVQQHNSKYLAGQSSFWMDLNQFSDLSDSEWAARFFEDVDREEDALDILTGSYSCQSTYKGNNNAAECIDCQPSADNPQESVYYWQDAKYNNANQVMVTGIKDQGSCGSCWAFAAAAVMEAQLCLQNYYNCSTWSGISEQNCVDCVLCDSNERNPIVGPYCSHGCSGGNSQNCWYYASVNGGIASEDSYPYFSGTTRTEGSCNYTSTDNVFVKNQTIDHNNICVKAPQGNEQVMMQAINNFGPIKVSLYASDPDFKHYSGGIYTADMSRNACPEGKTGHAVTLTGYGTYNGTSVEDYWMLRNSWGTSWGINGYMKFRRNYNEGNKYGMCSVGKYPYWTYITTN